MALELAVTASPPPENRSEGFDDFDESGWWFHPDPTSSTASRAPPCGSELVT